MQTLGLSAKPQPTDNIFKRLLWPVIANGYDADLLGQQGFWLCFGVAVLSIIGLSAAGEPLLGLLVGAAYFLGGLGVRQNDLAAASLIFLSYLLGRIASVESMYLGLPSANPILSIIATMLLFANVRATMLIRRWKSAGTSDDVGEMPERASETLGDKIANVLPEMFWPYARFAFFVLVAISMAVQILAMIGMPSLVRLAR